MRFVQITDFGKALVRALFARATQIYPLLLSRDASGSLTVIQITLRSGLGFGKRVCNEITNQLMQGNPLR